jgi:hypothetical protein
MHRYKLESLTSRAYGVLLHNVSKAAAESFASNTDLQVPELPVGLDNYDPRIQAALVADINIYSRRLTDAISKLDQ